MPKNVPGIADEPTYFILTLFLDKCSFDQYPFQHPAPFSSPIFLTEMNFEQGIKGGDASREKNGR